MGNKFSVRSVLWTNLINDLQAKAAMASSARPVHTAVLGALLCCAAFTSGRGTRAVDQVSEADLQRLLHGIIEELGIARPRVEYPAHQATNIVGPQSIQGGHHLFYVL